ncbi:MAG: beta-phosphoglucomutase [Flavobacteriales bacterium]|nr:beta-phosphoglucomutase [Flavobacteriia bacterium]NCP07100.1 beta-phosphoglucomutase [Flavobacteriales bacterium]NCP52947.1 beta-phosphoglucomutase [Flavobacteriales bacterium]NCP61349.1 beta-phosphoglucomutase [Flavobacteriales bacterium]NCT16083.1 beta-phosphoglucomutase [Flavobacteriales bacterium]
MKKKGFIFDLDGVIVDTAKYHFLAWKKLANSIGVDFTEHQNEQLKGVSRIESLKKILKWGDITLSEEDFNRLMADKNTNYLSYIDKMDESKILPDVIKVIQFLMDKKQPIALGSASKNSVEILNKVNLFSQFDVIVDGNAVTKAKPDPEVFLKAAEAIQIKPENCIVFEDSVAGIQAANKANMISIGIGESSVLNEADVVFSNFTEMSLDFLEKLLTTEKSQLKEI